MKAVGARLDINRLELVVDNEKLRLKKLPNPSEDFVRAGFKMYASERVEVDPGGFTVCKVVHCPVLQEERCFVNSKAGSGLMFNVFEQSNQDGVINSLSIRNKTKLPITVQRGQIIGNLYLVETVEIR